MAEVAATAFLDRSVPTCKSLMRIPPPIVMVFAAALLASACASTRVSFTPATSSASLCQQPNENLSALVLWALQWRPEQKDVALREAAAAQGITRFFDTSVCFAHTEVRRIPLDALNTEAQLQLQLQPLIAASGRRPERVLLVVVRELGPVVKLLSSAALVEGGTEVMLDLREHPLGARPAQTFSVHWQRGGPGVVEGVASLPEDMEAALTASLKPGGP